jgi:hypothetical protein
MRFPPPRKAGLSGQLSDLSRKAERDKALQCGVDSGLRFSIGKKIITRRRGAAESPLSGAMSGDTSSGAILSALFVRQEICPGYCRKSTP